MIAKINSYKITTLLKTLKVFLILAFLYFITDYLINNYKNLSNYKFDVSIDIFIVSLVLLILLLLINTNLWFFITKYFKCNIEYKLTINKRINSELGKYIPGRVFGYGYLYLIYKSNNKNIKRFAISSYYELLLSTISAISFFSIIQMFVDYDYLKEYRSYFMIAGALSFIVIHPKAVEMVLRLFNKFKSEKIDIRNGSVEYKSILLIYTGYIILWFLFGTAFYILASSITDTGGKGFIYWTGLFSVSSFAGFLAFFMPSGLGAREGMLIVLLTGVVGETTAIVISIISRLWIIVGDLILFGAANLLSITGEKILKSKYNIMK